MSNPSSAANDTNDPGTGGSISSGTMIDTPEREARLVELEATLSALRVQVREAEERAARAEAEAAARVSVDPIRNIEADLADAQEQIRIAEERAARAETIMAAGAAHNDIPTYETPHRGILRSGGFGPEPSEYFSDDALAVPIMGYPGNRSSVLVGGKPKADWSGLDGTPPQATPFIRRFEAGNSNEIKAYHAFYAAFGSYVHEED